VIVLLIAAIIAGCAIAPMPQIPQIRMPTPEEIGRQMDEAMGRGEVPAEVADEDGVQVVFQSGHTSSLTAVGVSADGRYLISGGQDEQIRVWDVASGQETRAITTNGFGGPRRVGFTSDGSHLFVESFGGVAVYDRLQGTKISESRIPLTGGNGRIRAEERQERGTFAAPATVLIDTASGAEIWRTTAGAAAQPAAASADGDSLVIREVKFTGDNASSTLRLWRVSTRKSIPIEEFGEQAINIMLSSHGRWLAVEDVQRGLAIIDATTGKIVSRIQRRGLPGQSLSNTMVFSPDESLLAHASYDGHATVWRVPDGTEVTSFEATAINFSEDGKTLVLGDTNGGAPYLRDVASGAETRLSASTAKVNGLALADGGAALIVSNSDGAAREWDLATGEITRSFPCPRATGTWSVATAPTSPLLAMGCMDGSITLWNRATGDRIGELAPSGPVGQYQMTAVAFGRGGDAGLLLAGTRGEIVVWDIASRAVRRRIQLPPGAPPPDFGNGGEVLEAAGMSAQTAQDGYNQIMSLAIDPTGRFVAVGRSNEVTLWALDAGQLVRRMGTPRPGSIAAQAAQAPPMTEEQMKKMFGRSGGGLLGGLSGRGGRNQPNVIVAPNADPLDAMDDILSASRGAHHLAFSNDGLRLYGDAATWEVATGYPIVPQSDAAVYDPANPQAYVDSMMKKVGRRTATSGPVAVSPDGKWVARTTERVIRISDAATEREVAELKGHRGTILALAFSSDGQRIVSGGEDGAVRVWSMPGGRELVALTALGAQDFVAVTPDQYYRVSKARLSGVAFRQNGVLYPFEQFDIKFNRPDIILERLGRAPAALVQSYRQSYQRRLSKLGFTEATLASTSALPNVSLNAVAVPVTTAATSLNLDVHADGAGVPLDRMNVFVNDVPVYGTRGVAIESNPVTVDRRVTVPLVKGRNKIQVSVHNARGVESLRQTAYTTSTAEREPAQVWVVAIGVSQYQRPEYSLRYAAKDAADIADVYRSLGARTHVLNVSNADATRQGIEAARRWLDQAKPDDLVIVFAAGHGMTDSHQNYYFGTYDIDPDEPGRAGLPFESFENLLDGIAPLRKLLLVDTCFSGEIDKDEPAPAPASTVAAGAGTVVMRSFKAVRGVATVADDSASATAPPSVRFQQDWFADLRRGTGAVVISSASGSEYALEGEQWNNGVFTYALLDGLKNRAADANGDRDVTVGELQAYVSAKVVELTRGGQNPTVRRENLAYDFTVF
jgi:WD40 repeat protein